MTKKMAVFSAELDFVKKNTKKERDINMQVKLQKTTEQAVFKVNLEILKLVVESVAIVVSAIAIGVDIAKLNKEEKPQEIKVIVEEETVNAEISAIQKSAVISETTIQEEPLTAVVLKETDTATALESPAQIAICDENASAISETLHIVDYPKVTVWDKAKRKYVAAVYNETTGKYEPENGYTVQEKILPAIITAIITASFIAFIFYLC